LGDEPKKRPKVPMVKLREEYETWSKANKRPRTVMNDTALVQGSKCDWSVARSA
jgi:hypothetical protein